MSPEPGSAARALPAAPAPTALPDAVLRWMRTASLGLAGALVLLGLAWELWLAPTGRGTLALKVLPLALALPGLARHRLYTYRWLSLLVWLYVLEGLLRSTTERGVPALLAGVEVALAIALFAVASAYIRRRLRGASGTSRTGGTGGSSGSSGTSEAGGA